MDHINHERDDNSWNNLRQASRKENTKNRKLNINNKSGCSGVSWDKSCGKWKIQLKINRKSVYCGVDSDLDAAIEKCKEAQQKFGFHPNHGEEQCLA